MNPAAKPIDAAMSIFSCGAARPRRSYLKQDKHISLNILEKIDIFHMYNNLTIRIINWTIITDIPMSMGM